MAGAENEDTLIVGLDAATQPNKFGYALGRVSAGLLQVVRAGTLKDVRCSDALSTIIVPELEKASRALVAIDAPLGWPAPMGAALATHSAGDVIDVQRDNLFHRVTDDFIRSKTNKPPLEVGASFIARAAHAALDVLAVLREKTRLPIPLAWTPDFQGVAVIEVYPYATLSAWDCALFNYKKDSSVRRVIGERLLPRMLFEVSHALESPDAFDACLCLLAAQDFLEGNSWPPENYEKALKEGWIWKRRSHA